MDEWYAKMKNALLKGGKFLEEIGLDYTLAGGTLLGAIRGGELIRHDNDVDVAVLAEDITKEIYHKLIEAPNLMGENKSCHYKYCHITLQYGGVHFDIFPLHKEGDKRLFNQAGDSCLVWPAHYFDKLDKVTMYDRVWKTPHTPEEFLEVMYGKDWRIPDKEFKWQASLNYRELIVDTSGLGYCLPEDK